MITYLNNKEYEGLTSRYKKYRVIKNSDDNQFYLETFNQLFEWDEPDDFHHIVVKDETNRLDLISYRLYGSPEYWWAIALVNQIIDPFIIPEGLVLTIPAIEALHRNSIL